MKKKTIFEPVFHTQVTFLSGDKKSVLSTLTKNTTTK